MGTFFLLLGPSAHPRFRGGIRSRSINERNFEVYRFRVRCFLATRHYYFTSHERLPRTKVYNNGTLLM